MKTYWLNIEPKKASSMDGSTYHDIRTVGIENDSSAMMVEASAKSHLSEAGVRQRRLVNWMVELFSGHIGKLMATRGETKGASDVKYLPRKVQTSLDEVAEVIYLPRFDEKAHALVGADGKSLKMSRKAQSQLHEYVATIANYYKDNPFHNWEHACHVTMAVEKFLKRIVTPDIAIVGAKDKEIANELHNFTHGINSDQLTILAILFSALIHDA